MPEVRSGASTSTLNENNVEPPRPPRVHATSTSEDGIVPDRTDDEAEPRDASPRRRPPPRRPNPPDLEDALTRLTQTVERMVAHQQPAPAAAEVAEDPAFNWEALRSPLDAPFPLPPTGVVQRVAAGLFAKLQVGALTGRDQNEVRFVLDILADWEDLDQELRTRSSTFVP